VKCKRRAAVYISVYFISFRFILISVRFCRL